MTPVPPSADLIRIPLRGLTGKARHHGAAPTFHGDLTGADLVVGPGSA